MSTATTDSEQFTSAVRQGTAKSGVPANAIRSGSVELAIADSLADDSTPIQIIEGVPETPERDVAVSRRPFSIFLRIRWRFSSER